MIRTSFEKGMYVRRVDNPNPAETIIYIHGLGESGFCFEELVSDLRLRDLSHLIFDLPGYGKSPWPERPLSLGEQADYIAQWMKSKEIGRVVVLGHSMGGVIGLMFCEKYPEIARAFINVEGNISLEDCSFSGRTVKYSSEEFFERGIEITRDIIYRDGLDEYVPRSYYQSLDMCNPRAFYMNSVELVELSGTEKPAVRQSTLNVPNIYILGHPRGTGEHSRNLMTAAGVEWKAVEDAGHWVFIDQKAAFVDEMLNFLNRIPHA